MSSILRTNRYDVAIIGGGIMGQCVAYFLKTKSKFLNVLVVEKDPSYKEASTVLSVGGIRQQFSLEENIRMSLFGVEFLTNIRNYLMNDVDVQFKPHGYLTLASEKGAECLRKNVRLQQTLECKIDLHTASGLKEKFPWLNVDGIECGSYGCQNEGWFDPWALLSAIKAKNQKIGVEFLHANFQQFAINKTQSGPHTKQTVNAFHVDNSQIHFDKCVIAGGHESGKIGRTAEIGHGLHLLSHAIPVEPRKRYVYCFECKRGPKITPLLVDITGLYFRKDGSGNRYICGKSPGCDEPEPRVDSLDVDYSFFEETLWPNLARRVPAFEDIKVTSAWAGFYDYNTFDQNGIIGRHPYYDNMYVASGFSGHGIQQGPAVGRAIAELIVDGRFLTIDLTRLGFERVVMNTRMREDCIV